MNAVEAMRAIRDGSRRTALLISARKAEQCGTLLEVGDSDPELALAPIDNPEKYPPIRFGDYALWFASKSYQHMAARLRTLKRGDAG